MVCNLPMDNPDKALIEHHGGPAKLANKLGFDTRNGGVQRVQNWLTRGIPYRVKFERQDLFGPKILRRLMDKKEAA